MGTGTVRPSTRKPSSRKNCEVLRWFWANGAPHVMRFAETSVKTWELSRVVVLKFGGPDAMGFMYPGGYMIAPLFNP